MRAANEPTIHRAGDGYLVIQPEGGGISPEEVTESFWALEIAQALDKHYPGHPWRVDFQGGALVVRHDQISWAVALRTGRRGFGTLLPPHRFGTLGEAVRKAVTGAGEMLECFSMPRGRWQEDRPPVCPGWARGKSRDFT